MSVRNTHSDVGSNMSWAGILESKLGSVFISCLPPNCRDSVTSYAPPPFCDRQYSQTVSYNKPSSNYFWWVIFVIETKSDLPPVSLPTQKLTVSV